MNLYLTDKDLAARLGVSRTTPWRWAQRGTFPKPIVFSAGCTRWRLADVEKWEQERAAERGAP